MQTTPFTPFAEPSYRVYSPNEIHYLAPSPLRGAPPPQSRGWFAVGFVMLVVCLIGGGSFAALRALNVDLTSARTSLLPTPDAPLAPAAALAVPSSPVAAAPVAAAPAFVPAEATGLTSANARRKARGSRHNPPAIVSIPRGGVVTTARSAPKPAAKPAAALPPNPF